MTNKIFLLVQKNNNRSGRGKGTKVKFGNFAERGRMVGNKDPKLPQINEDGPSSGPGSRSGGGGYNKTFKSNI
jgi:hypothetical protein